MTTGKLQTLERGIDALLLISRSADGVRVGEIASELGLHRAVAYRIVATLSDRAMVRRLDDGRIILGAGAYLLGAKTVDSIRIMAQPVLEELAARTGATAFLSSAEGDECVVVMTAEPRNALINIHYRVGIRHPIDRGAAGIAILARRSEHPGESEDVRQARAQGYSLTRGQLHKGAIGVSSAVPLPRDTFSGLEFSIGVVALEELDVATAVDAVPAAAMALAECFG